MASPALAGLRTHFVNKKLLIDLIGVLLILLVVVVGYKLSPMLLPRADVTVQPEAGCDLQRQSCPAVLPGGGKLALEMGTHPIPLVKPFEVRIKVEDFVPGRVEIDFAGIEMNMGYNRLQLAPRGDGSYVAEATLPVCITGQMAWQATVLVESGSERIAIPYRFITGVHE